MTVTIEDHGSVRVVTIDRPSVRNAVDGPTAQLLYDAFVDGAEAERIGLANRVVAPGATLAEAMVLAEQLAALPQRCLRSDRRSVHEQWSLGLGDALSRETRLGLDTIRSGETLEGASRFAAGAGRHGSPVAD